MIVLEAVLLDSSVDVSIYFLELEPRRTLARYLFDVESSGCYEVL